jgi:hypothetical protein
VQDHGPDLNILAAPSDMTSGGDRLADPQPSGYFFRGLDLKYGIGAFGYRRAGHDADGLTGLDGPGKGTTRQDFTHDFQFKGIVRSRTKGFLSVEGIAIHRRSIKRRHGDLGYDIHGQHPAGSLVQADIFRRQRVQAVGEQCDDVGHFGPIAKPPHPHVKERCGSGPPTGRF